MSARSLSSRLARAVRGRRGLVALAVLGVIIASVAATVSSFTSRTGNSGNRFSTAAQFPVRNTTPPQVSGTPADGQTLTVTAGTWRGTPTSYVYEWQKCTPGASPTCEAFAVTSATTATSATRVLAYEQAGFTVRVKVTAANAAGSQSAVSAATAMVTSNRPYKISPPTISGTKAGETLTADKGTWGGAAPLAYAYRWERCDGDGANCVTVAGQTGATLNSTPNDATNVVRVVVTVTNGAGSANDTAKTDRLRWPDLTAAAGLVGTAEVGMRLTSSPGFNAPVKQDSVEYQWQRCSDATTCSDIPGAVEPNYTTTTVDVGKFLRYHLKATAADGLSSVDKDGQLTDSTVKARRMASVGDRPETLATAPDGRLFVGGGTNMRFATAYTGPLAAVSRDAGGQLAQIAKTPLVKESPSSSAAVVGDGKGGYILGVTDLKLPDGSTRSLIRIKGDGTVDLGYPQVTGRVTALARDSAGTIYVGGGFSQLGGQARNNVGAISADGNVTSWNPNADGFVYNIAPGPGGRVYLVGDFLNLGGVAHARVGLVMADGTVVHSFAPPASIWGPGSCSAGRGLAVAPDGVVYVSGFNCGTPFTGYVHAFNPDGSKLSGFTTATFDHNPHALHLNGDTLYAGGFFSQANGAPRARLASFNRMTGAMTTWHPSLDSNVWALASADGKLYAGGQFTSVDGSPRNYSAAFDITSATPTLTDWAPKIDNSVYGLTVEGGGVQMTGEMTWWGTTKRSGLAVLDADGQLMDTKAPIDAGAVKAIALNANDAWIGGSFATVNGADRKALARIDATTGAVSVDNYTLGQTGAVEALLYTNGSLWVGGGLSGGSVQRFTGGSALTPSTDRPNYNGPVYSLAALANNRIAVGGAATSGNTFWSDPNATYNCFGSTLSNLVGIWLDAVTSHGCTGGIDFQAYARVTNTNPGANPYPQIAGGVFAISAGPSGNFLQAVGGFRDALNGPTVNGMYWDWAPADPTMSWATLNFNGLAWDVLWDPNVNAFVTGGGFTTANGVARRYLAQHGLSPTPNGWNPKLGGGTAVYALARFGTTIYAGGDFTTTDGMPSGNLVALNDSTGVWITHNQ